MHFVPPENAFSKNGIDKHFDVVQAPHLVYRPYSLHFRAREDAYHNSGPRGTQRTLTSHANLLAAYRKTERMRVDSWLAGMPRGERATHD